jgi:hypothetical protein
VGGYGVREGLWGGMGTYISGSLLMSAIAAIGIPKLLAGPQKSAPQVSAIEHVHCLLLVAKSHRKSFNVSQLFLLAQTSIRDPQSQSMSGTYESSRSNRCTCLSESSH